MKFLVNNNLDNIIKKIIYDKEIFVMDVDDVIVNFKNFFINEINRRFKINLKEEEIVTYNIYKLLPLKEKGITSDDVANLLKDMSKKEEFTKLKLNNGIYETVEFLVNDKEYSNFFINTARTEKLYDNAKYLTIKTLENTGLKFNKNNIIFDPYKEYVAKSLNAKLFFEDHPSIALRIIEKGIPVVMPTRFWNIKSIRDTHMLSYDDLSKKYELINKLKKYENKMLFRIDSFEEFYDYLRTI